MKFPGKSRVAVAAPSRTHFDVSQNYVGTLDFGNLVPVNWRMCRNGEHYKVKPMSFLRCAPLVVPTFGRVRMIMDTFFVPYHQVFNNWNNFKTRQHYVNPSGTSYSVDRVPTIAQNDLCKIFYGVDGTSVVTSSSFVTPSPWYQIDADNRFAIGQLNQHLENRDWSDYIQAMPDDFFYDFVIGFKNNVDGEVTEVRFATLTKFGKACYNIMLSLGYPISFGFVDDFDHTVAGTHLVVADSTHKYSALNFLAFVKIYLDWYQSNQFTNDSALRQLFQKISTSQYGGDLAFNDIVNLLTNYVRCYDQDLYTASWLTPNADSDVVGLRTPDTGFDKDSYVINSSEGVRVQGTSSGVSMRNITIAQRLQNYIDRWRIGGKRDVDRDLVQFGVKSDDVRSHRSRLVNSYSQDLMISDVMSNSENMDSGLQLGSYAGKGLSYGNSDFSFEPGDDGVLITIASLVPETGYVFGTPKEMEDLVLFDFLQPEFDSVGVEAIAFGQLSNRGNHLWATSDPTLKSIFGYVPRYAHLKVGHDTLAGDFRVPSLNVGSDAWHLFRRDYKNNLANNEYFRQICNYTVNNPNVQNAQTDSFDRIFNVTDSAEDHFYLFCNFDMQLEAPYISIADSMQPVYDGKHHNDVNVGYNGAQL